MADTHSVVNIWTKIGLGGLRLAHASSVYEDPRLAITGRDCLPDAGSWELVGTYHLQSNRFLRLKELEKLADRYVAFQSAPRPCGEIVLPTPDA